MTATTTGQKFEQLWLPTFALATDNFAAGAYRMPRPDALARRYVQANPRALVNLIVVDVDHTDAALRAVSAVGSHPMPTAVVENPTNGHAHVLWALAEPITTTEYAHRKPVAYAAAVTEGLRRVLDGDKAYCGLLTKNPAHPHWRTEWFTTEPRTLDDLAAGLGDRMPPRGWRKATGYREEVAGLGRNCALFEECRLEAYREARRIRQRHERPTVQDSADLLAYVTAHAVALNASFPEPLPASEVRAIAASIHRWTTTKFYGWTDSRVVNAATFTAIQSHRGKNSGKTRRAKAQEVWEA